MDSSCDSLGDHCRGHFVHFPDLEKLEKNVKRQLDSGFDREKLAKDMQQLYSRDSMHGQFMSIYQELIEKV